MWLLSARNPKQNSPDFSIATAANTNRIGHIGDMLIGQRYAAAPGMDAYFFGVAPQGLAHIEITNAKCSGAVWSAEWSSSINRSSRSIGGIVGPKRGMVLQSWGG